MTRCRHRDKTIRADHKKASDKKFLKNYVNFIVILSLNKVFRDKQELWLPAGCEPGEKEERI